MLVASSRPPSGSPVVSLLLLSSFFFQAEDGIRDYKVTGVQTCALPISARRSGQEAIELGNRFRFARPSQLAGLLDSRRKEIGRASCRERGSIMAAAVCSKSRDRPEGNTLAPSSRVAYTAQTTCVASA